MTKLVLKAFGGMLPVIDDRLLPNNNSPEAINSWLYTGMLQGFREPQLIYTLGNPSARTVFRVPKGTPTVEFITDSFWLEFLNVNTSVVRSPITDTDDPRYYWADGINPPGYTTLSRLVDGDPPLVLGIPRPEVAPGLTSSGGVGIAEDRAYLYTWVSQYNEEGPPSDPSPVVTGKIDDTWHVTFTAPTADDIANRALAFTNIYRTVTAADGSADYYFVAQIPITTLTYDDIVPSDQLPLNRPLPSTYWTAPPSNLQGFCSLPNGMIAGWVGQELWYCEPFRPHAWPAPYQTSVDFNIVGMAALDQMLVIGTQNVAYSATGVHPSAVTTRIITGSEPCLSQRSFAVTPTGVLYAGPNGLMMCTSAGASNITRDFISTDKWRTLLFLNQLNAALMNGAYYCYSGTLEAAFQESAFQDDAFQIDVVAVSRDGALIDLVDRRVAVTVLHDDNPTYNVIQDVWTAEVLLVRNGNVYLHSLVQGDRTDYDWTSKVYQLLLPENFGAMKIVLSNAADTPSGTLDYYANGTLKLSRPIPLDGRPFRLPSGFKTDNIQIRTTGNVDINQIELATTMRELAAV